MKNLNRRRFLLQTAALGGAAFLPSCCSRSPFDTGPQIQFGLVTYLWGQHWDLNTLIRNCEASGVLGVELRTTHKHGVEPRLSPKERLAVRKTFESSKVTLVGPGSNEKFHMPDPKALRQAVQRTKAFLQLSADVGGTGVKVKPDTLPPKVPRQKTIQQIGAALRELGDFAATLNQEVRVEVHGHKTQDIPTMRDIMVAADHPHARICWNSNKEDLLGEGLEKNFHLLRPYFGATAHVREFNIGTYPYDRLMPLFPKTDWKGWVLLEARRMPRNPIPAMIEQREMFNRLLVGKSLSPAQK